MWSRPSSPWADSSSRVVPPIAIIPTGTARSSSSPRRSRAGSSPSPPSSSSTAPSAASSRDPRCARSVWAFSSCSVPRSSTSPSGSTWSVPVAATQHVLADVWTSGGIVVGLGLVRFTGLAWLDPVVALLVALWLMWTGFKLVRHAAGGLLDEEDPALLNSVLAALQRHLGNGVIRVHHLRAIRSGRFQHVEAHLVVPEFWSVERAHDLSEEVAARTMRDLGAEGEMVFHTDPCHRIYCSVCDLADCPIRREPYRATIPMTLEEAVQPDLPRVAPGA